MGAVDQISRLGLDIETSGLIRGASAVDRFANSADRAEREATELERRTKSMGQTMSVMGGMAQQLALQLAAAFSVGAVIRANDAWVSATNQIRLVTDGARELRDMTQQVYDLSQRTASRFEAMTGLYASIQRAAGAAIGSQREVLRVTETIAKLASASGGPEGSRNAALFQLRQMLQGAVVQAQEFNSLVDGTPLLVQAIADSIGVTRGELRRMVLDGRLATSQVIEALQEQADEADALFSRVAFTMGDAFIRLQNAFQKLVGTNLGPLFAGIVEGISFVAGHLELIIPLINGVAAALAVAFAPAVVLAFGGALTAVFNLIAAHPIAALVGAIVAGASALAAFSDEIVIARHEITGFGDDMSETLDVTVTLADYFEAFFTVIGRKAALVWQTISDGASELVETVMAKLREWLPGLASWAELAIKVVIQIPRTIVGAFTGMVAAIAEVLRDVPGLLTAAFQEGANGAIGALEGLLNRAVDGINTLLGESGSALRLGAVEFGRIETDFADRGARIAAAFQRGFSEGAAGFDDSFRAIAESVSGFWDEINAEAHNIALERAMAERRAAEEAAAQAAAQAAAAGDAAAANKLAQQMRDRRAMFEDLQAQLALKEREYELYALTEDLLARWPEYYRAAAGGAEDLEAAARAIAEADARSVTSLQRQIAARRQAAQMAQDQADQAELIGAAALGMHELEVAERMQDLLRQNAEYYEEMGKAGRDLARADAERLIANERILDNLTEQAERARDIAEAPVKNLRENFDRATDNFWDTFVIDAERAFSDLGDAFENMWRQLQADILRDLFNPFLTAIRESIVNAVSGAGQGNPFASLFNFGAGAGSGQGGGLLGSLGNMIGSIFGSGTQPLQFTPGVGQANAAWAAQGGGGFMGLIGNFATGNAIASALGLVGNANGGMIGGGIGSMIGNMILPGIGGIIGSFLGSTIGGLFGPGISSEAAYATINANGSVGQITGEGSAQTNQAITQVAARIDEGVDLMAALGGVTTAQITELFLAAQRARSGYRIDGGPWVQTNAVGDPNELASGALGALLGSTTFDNATLEAVRAAMVGAGKSFEETIEVLGKLHDVLPATNEVTSQWEQALATLNDTFDDLRASTEGVAGAAEQLDQAFAQAKAALRDSFQESIEDAITGIENPLELQFRELMEVQAQRLADANALGADVARVMHLNELELARFIEQAAGSAAAFENLNAIFADLIASAAAAGQATQPLIDAYNQARAGVVTAFDDQVAQQLANLTNPTLGALKALLDAQKARLDQARAIGANILAVERLNAAEQRAFFDGLSDEQKQALASHLGLIEDFTGRIAVVLSQLGDELNTRIDQVDQMRSDLLAQADAMRSLSENLAATRQGIVDRYGALTPMAGVEALRERFAALADEARGGNDSALQALGQVGQQLIEASRSLYGSTATFRGDYDLVTQVLEEAQGLALGRADALESQAQTLIEQRDLLIEIRNILARPDPSLEALELYLGQLDANQDVVANLLGQYLQLAAQEAGQQIDLGALYQQATNAAQTPPLAASQSTALAPAPAAANGSTVTTPSTNTGAGITPADSATAQMVAVLIDVVEQGNDRQEDAQRDIRRELRNLNERLGVGGSGTAAA